MKGPVIRPSDSIRREYQTALEVYIKRMGTELMREVAGAYASQGGEFQPKEVTEDASAAEWLKGVLSDFFSGWQKKFDAMAEKRAKWLADRTDKASSTQVQRMLKDIGFTVEFKNSAYVGGELERIVKDNVSLIRSIPERMHDRVEKIVMRGVSAGNDRHYIATELKKEFGVTERRARFIARDQTQKASAAISIAKSEEVGYEYGFWVHRSISKIPRSTHIGKQMNRQRFKLSDGLYDPDPRVNRKVKPGELPGCNCTFELDLSSFRPQMAQDSVIIRPCKPTYADIKECLANPPKEAA